MNLDSLASAEESWNVLTGELKRFIARRIPNEADVEDVLQDALRKIHSHLHRAPQDGNLSPWLYRIARNCIVDYYRDYERKRRPTITLESAGQLAGDLEKGSAETDQTRAEIGGWLRPMIDQLPQKYAEALVLADLEGMPQAELALRLGLSLSGAKSRVQRARVQLKASLLACCRFEFDSLGRVIDYERKRSNCCCQC
jgi:RNA polymerase sigma-70 factor (ECF subfamily)